MAEEDDASKTEEPSDKKRSKAREEGDVASSQELKSWALLLGALFGMIFMAPGIATGVRESIVRFIEAPHTIALDPMHLRQIMTNLLAEMGAAMWPLLGLFVLLALAANVGQVGLKLTPKAIQPKPSKISPIAGFKKIFSAKQAIEFVKGLFKVVPVGLLAFVLVVPMMADIEVQPGMEMGQVLVRMRDIAIVLIVATVGLMLVISVADYVWQKYSQTKKLRMTKQEVKDEHKQSEGDPLVKARLRRLRMERAQQRMMAAVPTADVVITNPTHYAVALSYKIDDMQAPKLVAKGVDHIAATIREIAEENDVPIVENPPLARALYASCELDQEIPYEHYKAVAEVIGYVMRLKGGLS